MRTTSRASRSMWTQLMSTGVPFLFFVALMAAGQAVTKEVFEWTFGVLDMVRASAEMGRFLNDIASYKVKRCIHFD